jgi:hypothetical protein
MLGKFVKMLEWVGHGNTAVQIAGWFGLPTVGVGSVAWAMTFFGSAVEGWSVTGVWLASLSAGTMAATIYAALAIGIAYSRRDTKLAEPAASEETKPSEPPAIMKWLNIADAMNSFADKHLIDSRDDWLRKLNESLEKGYAAEDKINEITKRGTIIFDDGSRENQQIDRERRMMLACVRQHSLAESELPIVWDAIRSDVLNKLGNGALIAKGFRTPHSGGMPEIIIPQDEWRILALDNIKSEVTTKREGHVAYIGVVIGQPEEA